MSWWPTTDAERAAHRDWRAEVWDGDTLLGFRAWLTVRDTETGVSPANGETGEATIDGHPLTLGDKVWDYDLRPAYVIEVHHVAQDGTVWYKTSRTVDGSGAGNLFDAKRMWFRHPSTGVRA